VANYISDSIIKDASLVYIKLSGDAVELSNQWI